MPRPTQLDSSMDFTVKINGKDLYAYGVVPYQAAQLGAGPAQIYANSPPLRHAAYAFSGAFRPRTFPITGSIFASSVAHLHANLDALKEEIQSLRGKSMNTPAPIKLEFANLTDRHFKCYYAGGELSVRDLVGRPTSERITNFTLPLVMLSPFAHANSKTHAAPSGTGPSFTVLDTGTAACPVVVELEGASTSPKFGICNSAFHADFDWDLIAKIIDDTDNTGTSGATTKSDQFEPGEYGGRYIQGTGFTTSWANIISNPDECTIIMVGAAGFAASAGGDQTLLEYWINADNGWRIEFQTSGNTFFFERERATASVNVSSAAQTFASGDAVTLAASMGPAGMKFYKDGGTPTTAVTTTGIVGSTGTLYLGDYAASQRPDWKYDYLYVFPYQLTDEEVRRYSLNPQLVKSANVIKSKTGNLSANERSILDTEFATIDKLTTAVVKTNDFSNWDGNGNPWLHPKQSCFYVPSTETIGGVKVAYHKWYL